MAIDDNTSYELTGAQVKDLANKIKAKAADNIFVGATSAIPGSKGLVPAPQAGDDTKFLSGDGTWKTAGGGSTYTAGNGIDITNDEISIDTSVVAELSDIPTAFTGATSSTAGTSGLVPAPAAGDQDKVLSGAGTWVTQSGGTTYTAGNHIDITNDVISAEGYIWGDDAAPASTPTSTITSAMIVDGTIQATDIATGVVPVITMTDTDPGEGSPLAANNFIAVYGDDPSNMNYSLTEAKTGATWIDGSPIYKKTIDFGALPNNSGKSIAHGITNLGTVVNFYGVAYNPNTKMRIKTDYPYPEYAIRTTVNDTYVTISCGVDQRAFTQSYVTLYYTKSS